MVRGFSSDVLTEAVAVQLVAALLASGAWFPFSSPEEFSLWHAKPTSSAAMARTISCNRVLSAH